MAPSPMRKFSKRIVPALPFLYELGRSSVE